MKSLCLTLCLVGGLGCGSTSAPDLDTTASAEPNLLEESLAAPRSYAIDVDGLTSVVSLRLGGDWAGDGGGYLSLPIQEGVVTVASSPDGSLQLEELAFSFDDIIVDPQDYPPQGAHLTDLGVVLSDASSDTTEWRDDAVDAAGRFDLILSWSAVKNGNVAPLADQDLQRLSFDLEVDDTSLNLESISNGLVWSFGDFITMSDVHINVHAAYDVDEMTPRPQ